MFKQLDLIGTGKKISEYTVVGLCFLWLPKIQCVKGESGITKKYVNNKNPLFLPNHYDTLSKCAMS